MRVLSNILADVIIWGIKICNGIDIQFEANVEKGRKCKYLTTLKKHMQ